MKRITLLLLATLALTSARAEDKVEEYGIFDRVGAGLTLGTDGIGIEVAAPITNYAAVRAGFAFWPKIKYSEKVNYKSDLYPSGDPRNDMTTRVQGKLNMFDGKVLFDAYPFGTRNSFHVTVGAYFGSSEIIKLTNLDPIERKDHLSGIEVGDYLIHENDEGFINANVKVNGFKPYVGVGFGRAVPKKRVGVAMDLGVMFHGKPSVNAFSPDDDKWVKVTSGDTGTEDNGIIDKICKVTVFPVLNIRITGRIF